MDRVRRSVEGFHQHKALIFGIGGEHSLTPPLVQAAADRLGGDFSKLTVVQFDAHADLRDEYEGRKNSHACAARRLIDLGTSLIAIGIRSFERDEWQLGRQSDHIQTFTAQQLATDPAEEPNLALKLMELTGPVYLTFDVDALDVHLAPATGTPQPGGLDWWQALNYLKILLTRRNRIQLAGVDLCETAPQPGTRVNEFTAARLVAKILGYHFSAQRRKND